MRGFLRVLTYLLNNSIPIMVKLEAQMLPGCTLWSFLCSIFHCFASLCRNCKEGICKKRAREYLADSWMICQSQTHFGWKFFAAPKNFEKFRSETRSKTRQNPQAASCQCSADLVRTCWSAAEVGRRPAGLILARSRAISNKFAH